MVLDQSTILSMNSFNYISSKILPAPLAGFCVCILEFRGGGPLVRRVRKYPWIFVKKLVSTIFLFFFAWYTMHFAGGAVATMRFERTAQNTTVEPLPDGKKLPMKRKMTLSDTTGASGSMKRNGD
jgi:hypothetical protein